MTAPEVVPRWPDEATVERVAEAIYCADPCYSGTWANQPPEIQGYYRPMARAALSVLPDPTADTVLLDQIRAIAAEWDDRGATWCMKRIAALLAGGGE